MAGLQLDAPAYGKIMAKKGMTAADAAAHHARMRAMLSRMGARGGRGLFGAVDVGTDAYWWDYGQLKLYQVRRTPRYGMGRNGKTCRVMCNGVYHDVVGV